MVIWNSPEKGSIAGTVIENRERFLKLEDFNRKIWFVDTTFIPFSDLTNKKVKIIGTDLGDNNFKAKRIIPWDQR